MARHVFYSLHYDEDRGRAAGILASKVLSPNAELSLADWNKLKRSGDFAVKRWIEKSLAGRSCTVVLIGAHTATRPWIHYEIKRSAELGLGLLGVHVHHLQDAKGRQSAKGASPFDHPACGLGAQAARVPVFDPPETDSRLAYHHVVDHLAQWTDEAVALRANPD